VHPNEQLLRKGYAAFESADLDTIQALFDDDVVVHTTGRNPIAGTFKGKDEVLGFLGTIIAMTDGTYKVQIHDVLANDDHVVALGNASGTRKGTSFSYHQFALYHVRDGKVTEAWFQSDDQYGEDEFWNL
jgi:uncharacterized protein